MNKNDQIEFNGKNPKHFIPWIFLSLFLHFLAILLMQRYSHELASLKPVDVELREVKRDPNKKQIVDIPELAQKIRPEKSKFLSKHHQQVKEETQSPRKLPQPWQDASVQGKMDAIKEDLARLDGDSLSKKTQTPLIPLRPETDFLEDIKLGEKTYINAEAFKHTSYYLEIKRKIEITWNPRSAMRNLWRRGISIERGMVATYVGVTLKPNGDLEEVVVLESSGVPSLDQEGIRAFRSSAPFTKVPTDLLSQDGKLRFEFGFIVMGR